MKKIKSLILVILALLCATCIAMVGCGGNNKGNGDENLPGPGAAEVTITFNRSSLLLAQNSEIPLIVYVTNTSERPVYTSMNPGVVSVNEKGVAKGLAEGEAVIKATVAGKTAECIIYVTGASYFPVVELNDYDASLVIGAKYTFNAFATIQNVVVDTAFTWSSSNENVATVSNGVVTAVGNGEAQIKAQAVIDGHTVYAVAKVNVLSGSTFVIDQENVKLAVNGSLKGEQDSATLTYTALNGDQTATVSSINWTSADESIATVDQNGKVSSVGAGEVEITATAVIDGVTKWSKAKVIVYKSNVGYTGLSLGEIDISKNLNRIKIADFGFAGYEGEMSVYQNGKKLYAYRWEDELGIFSKANYEKDPLSHDVQYGETTFEIELDDRIIEVDVTAVSMVIDTPQEVIEFSKAGHNDIGRACAYDGYFVLGKDIDMGGAFVNGPAMGTASNPDQSRNPAVGFQGVFDGRGYAISNLSVGTGGLFGVVGSKGVIKNFALTSCTLNPDTTLGGGIIAQMFFGTIQDVLIQGSFAGNYIALGGIAYVSTQGYVNNVVVEISNNSNRTDKGPGSALFCWLPSGTTTVVENAYVKTDLVIVDPGTSNDGKPNVHGTYDITETGNGIKATTLNGTLEYKDLTADFWDISADKHTAKFDQLGAYSISYYVQRSNSNTYQLKSKITGYGLEGQKLVLADKKFEGCTYAYDTNKINVFEGVVSKSTPAELVIYYTRYDDPIVKDENGNKVDLVYSYYTYADRDSGVKYGSPQSISGTYFGKSAYKYTAQTSEWYNRLILSCPSSGNRSGIPATKYVNEQGYKTMTFKLYAETLPSKIYFSKYYGDVINTSANVSLLNLSEFNVSDRERFVNVQNAQGAYVNAITAGQWYTVTVDITNMNAFNGASLNNICFLINKDATIYLADVTVSKTEFQLGQIA